MLPCHVSVVVLLCGLASAVPELPEQPEKSGDAASTLTASNTNSTNSSSGLKSSWPHGGCCNGCNTAFCSPQSGTCYNHKGKYYYYQCSVDVYPATPCCRYCSTQYCHFVTGECHDTAVGPGARYLETCYSSGRAARPLLRGSKSLPKPKVEIEEAEGTNSPSINGTEESLARTAGYYPRNDKVMCWNPNMSSSYGYMGVTSVSGCHARCDRESWCVGFTYLRCQSKCWLREEGIKCAPESNGEGFCWSYYGVIN